MRQTASLLPLLGLLFFAVTPDALAQRSDRRADDGGSIGLRVTPEASGIAWFGTWEGALSEAKRTNRPILLMSAAPSCRQVPGVW